MATISLPRARGKSQDDIFVATQWTLMWRKFRRHRLAMVSTAVVALLYLVAIFAEFVAPHDPNKRDVAYIHVPPQRIHLLGGETLWPYVNGLKQEQDERTWRRYYVPDPSVQHYVYFFVRGDPYKLWGLFPTDIHLFGTKEGPLYRGSSTACGSRSRWAWPAWPSPSSLARCSAPSPATTAARWTSSSSG
jgi:peptide/nickel transport system permease protein